MSAKHSARKILIVCQHYWPESFRINDIAEGLVERGHTVDVLCGIPNYPSGTFTKGYGFFTKRRQTHNGVTIIRAPEIPRGNNSNLRIMLNFISFPFFALFYLPWLANRRYDRILVYSLSPVFMAFPAIVLAKVTRIPLYIYVMDFWPHSLFSIFDFQNSFIRRLLTRMSYWHYKQATGAIGLYKGTQSRLIKEVGIPAERTIYIPQAPEKLYEQDVQDKNLSRRFAGTFNIAFAGNINPAQCFDIIVPAIKKLYDSGFTDLRVIILGDGMSRKWLEGEVARHGLSQVFVFEGMLPVHEIPKYHTIADALIVALSSSPLFEFSVPAKLYSYLAAGRPIVAAIDGESQRIIQQSKAGICVPSGDVQGLYKALHTIVSLSEQERAAMGANGRKYHFKYYERNATLDRLEAFVCEDTVMADSEYGAII